MIDFPIIDTHLHLWDPDLIRYPWLESVPLLNRKFLLDQYNTACEAVSVQKMVLVQCEADPNDYRREADWVSSLAVQDSRIAGIVPWAPLEEGDAVEPELAALVENPLIKGIRRIIQFEPDPAFCLRPDFIRGVQLLAEFNLSFDICIKGDEQTANALELVKQCPDVKFILDHIGKPFIKERRMDPWRQNVREFAGLPNVWCKVSGLVVEADTATWTPKDLAPYLAHVLESFGLDRVMFGGDWPVVLQAASLGRWMETLDGLTVELSPKERRRLFQDNANAFYRLSE